jgi:hypothetical protein
MKTLAGYEVLAAGAQVHICGEEILGLRMAIDCTDLQGVEEPEGKDPGRLVVSDGRTSSNACSGERYYTPL